MTEAGQRQKWWVMAAVTVGVFLSTIDGSMVNLALPVLARELDATFAAVQWVVLAYAFTLVALMLVAARLGDRYGKQRVYLAGFVVFTLGSLCCAASSSVGTLLAARVVQSVGASGLMALGAALVAEAFPPAERGRAMGLVGAVVSVGLVSGPTLGGLLLQALPWQALFLVNLPLGVLGTALTLRFVPTDSPVRAHPFDWRGALLLVGALLGFLLAITLGPHAAEPSVLLVTALLASLVGMFAFVKAQRTARSPLVDPELFSRAEVSVSVLTGSMVFLASSGLVLLVPFFLQDLQGRPPAAAGLLMAVPPLVMGLTSPLAGWLSDRVGTRPLATLGLGVLAVGYLLVSGLRLDTPAWEYLLRIACLGLGMGLFQSPNNSAVLGAVPRQQLATASGLLSLSRLLGQATGVALVGAAWTALTRLLDPTRAADPMLAPLEVQRHALSWTARGLALFLAGGLVLTLLHWRRDRLAPLGT
ncbi:MAG TPA: MFS transporter [Polyangiaceae bacterium]